MVRERGPSVSGLHYFCALFFSSFYIYCLHLHFLSLLRFFPKLKYVIIEMIIQHLFFVTAKAEQKKNFSAFRQLLLKLGFRYRTLYFIEHKLIAVIPNGRTYKTALTLSINIYVCRYMYKI